MLTGQVTCKSNQDVVCIFIVVAVAEAPRIAAKALNLEVEKLLAD
jgi:hypothetical protein